MIAQAINRAARRVPTWAIYILCGAHIGWAFWLAASGQLGPEPVKALEHVYGEKALQLIVAGLAITPLLKFARVNLVRFRRAVGLSAFAYLLAHLLVWLVLDVRVPAEIWADIVKRPYITVGMAGFALLLPLALTSNDWSVRRMGAQAWRRLHKLVYPAAVLGAVHFVMLVKGFQIEPLIYLGAVVVLLLMRWKPIAARTRRVPG
ncbi:protein-methionine-sulfoxide reductase heme-binding subunit MsrQ [Marimonas lutisalis]|uniref:protein-methionine-sulfoxide reductase heme-binding subunit MsrQ n=1 Tax=Marimonas lutisalis TaxID=2545756 RepID=UPI0010F890C3|nr:protein-methionine-sulfoxide reductase heme-binding subunit MsrQ [Marimonas lutisalis]